MNDALKMTLKKRSNSTRFLVLFVLFATFVWFINIYISKSKVWQKPIFNGFKVVHLDLKGAPLTITYFRKLMPLLRRMGATGVLIEYDDTFPYSGFIRHIPADNAYTLEEVSQINGIAYANNLTVIPLLNIASHLGLALKLDRYKYLREDPTDPTVLCLSNENGLNLINEMVDQLVRSHPKSKQLHFGGDGIHPVGFCHRCKKMMAKKQLDAFKLIVTHVADVMDPLVRLYKDIEVLMWDDFLRGMQIEGLWDSGISRYIVPVVKNFQPNGPNGLDKATVAKYSKVFPKIWIAGTFKETINSGQYLPNPQNHLKNYQNWMRTFSAHKNELKFEGIFLIGPQRLDHFAILSELLPVSLPSLAISLHELAGSHDYFSVKDMQVLNLLKCSQQYGIIRPIGSGTQCNYPGSDLLSVLHRLNRLQIRFKQIAESADAIGWLDDFNVRHRFSNPVLVENITKQMNDAKMQIRIVEAEIIRILKGIYSTSTVYEWVETYTRAFDKKINELLRKSSELGSMSVWPKRPMIIRS